MFHYLNSCVVSKVEETQEDKLQLTCFQSPGCTGMQDCIYQKRLGTSNQ